jgi:hypothetical protein
MGISLDWLWGWSVPLPSDSTSPNGVLRLMASAYGPVKCQHKVSGSLRWNFSVDFVSDLMGRFVVTDEHQVRI